MLNSDAIFFEEEVTLRTLTPSPPTPSPGPSPSHSRAASPLHSPRNLSSISHGFEDTIELYENAIEGARQHGFMQYEALGTHLF
jgi:hypothetical protein